MEWNAVLKYEGPDWPSEMTCINLHTAMRTAYHMYRGSSYWPYEIAADGKAYSLLEIKQYWEDHPETFPLRTWRY
ncbi:hypothetical protein ABNC42_14965 [Paenibacillus larvae]